MNGALRFSEAFILGLHAACYLAGLGGGRASTAEIARYLGVSEAHLAKVMQRLVRAGLLKSSRGPGGGFRLSRRASEISLMDIYESLEGPFSPTSCLLGRDACLQESCILSGLLEAVDGRFESYLRETHLGSANVPLRDKWRHAPSSRHKPSDARLQEGGGKSGASRAPTGKEGRSLKRKDDDPYFETKDRFKKGKE